NRSDDIYPEDWAPAPVSRCLDLLSLCRSRSLLDRFSLSSPFFVRHPPILESTLGARSPVPTEIPEGKWLGGFVSGEIHRPIGYTLSIQRGCPFDAPTRRPLRPPGRHCLRAGRGGGHLRPRPVEHPPPAGPGGLPPALRARAVRPGLAGARPGQPPWDLH